jgi:biotin carboxylase
MAGDRVLMVGCGWLGRPFVRSAHQRGFQVSVLDTEAILAWDPDGAELGPGDTRRLVASIDDEAWIGAAAQALREDGPVAGVVPFTEPHVRAAALLAEELGLPGPGLRAAWTSRNKYLQRELFARCGLPQPGYCLVRDEMTARRWAKGRYPVVLKPLSGSGSAGVQIAWSAREVSAWCASQREPFLAERYLAGPEFSAEAIVGDGALLFGNITRKITTPPPFCVELEHRIPAGCDAATTRRVGDLLAGVIRALGMGSGIVHLEFRLEPAGPHIMEVAVRMPGDLIMEVIEYATGVNLFDAAVAVAVGQRPDLRPRWQRAASVWYPVVPPGVVTRIDGVDSVSWLPGVRCVDLDVDVGSTIGPLRSSADRAGAVIVEAPGVAELDRRLELVSSELRITTAADSGAIPGQMEAALP